MSSSFVTPTERLAAFFDSSPPRTTYEDSDIDEVALLLEQCEHIASGCPRTYILFRTIGHLDTLEQLVKAGFSDQWFPIETHTLPSFLEPSIRATVVQQQGIILTKSLDLENGRHRHFTPSEALPFEILGRLGSGGYGQVDRIRSKTSFQLYALKRIRRRAAFGNASSREAVKGFLNEMKIMRSLEHRHVVRYIGSYTDKSYLGLVMSPVADSDLAAYTERLCGYFETAPLFNIPTTDGKELFVSIPSLSALQLRDHPAALEMASNLRTYFGCLTAALAYLHDQNIRHKDIKPQNILIYKANILFADFGLSRDFADDVGSTTSGLTPASPRYSAPEVAAYEARNTSSDIWSLGCVFVEMTAALHGLNVDWIKAFFAKVDSRSVHFHTNPAATARFIQALKNTVILTDRPSLTWTEQMLSLERNARPTAAHVLEMITSPEDDDTTSTTNIFCGICCVPEYESDSMDSLTDDFDVITAVPCIDPNIQAYQSTQDQASETGMGSNTVQAANDPLPVTFPGPEATISLETKKPLSVAEAAHEQHGGFPTTSHGEGNPESETAYAKDTEIVHRFDEPVLQNLSWRAQLPVLRSVDETEDYVLTLGSSNQVIRPIGSIGESLHGKVFGVPLHVSVLYASVDLIGYSTFNGSCLNGRIPLVVARCCELIRASSRYIDPYRGDMWTTLEDTNLRIIFDTPDYGRHHERDDRHTLDYIKILFQYLNSLPEPLLSQEARTKFRTAWWFVNGTRAMAAAMLSALQDQSVPDVHSTLILFLLNFFKITTRQPEDSKVLVKGLYTCFFGLALSHNENEESCDISAFMITYAGEILANIEDVNNADHQDSRPFLSRKHPPNTIAATSPRRIVSKGNEPLLTTSPVRQTLELTAQSASEDDGTGTADASSGSRRYAIMTRLRDQGYTDDDFTKYNQYINNYIEQDKRGGHHDVFGTPIWISMRYARASRSIKQDFDIVHDFKYTVPIVIAECCTFIYKRNLLNNSVDLTYFSKNFFQEEQEHIGSLVSVFESPPTFGAALAWENSADLQVITTLMYYLQSLPQEIIPPKIAKKLFPFVLVKVDPSQRSPTLKHVMTELQELPRPNRDTLFYLLAFFVGLRSKFTNIFTFDLAHVFHCGIAPAIAIDGWAWDELVLYLIKNAAHILADVNERSSTGLAPQYDTQYVKAIYSHNESNGGQAGDLFFQKGEVIRVLDKLNGEDWWWSGELNGKQGIFPTNYVTQCFDMEAELEGEVQQQSTEAQPDEHRETSSGRPKSRRFADAYNEQRGGGNKSSSGSSKKAMDFFRRIGRHRNEKW